MPSLAIAASWETTRPALARAYVEELMPDIMEGKIQPGRVLDRVTDLAGVPEGYRAMNERKAIKVLVEMA